MDASVPLLLSIWLPAVPPTSLWLWWRDSNPHGELPCIPANSESFALPYTPPLHITHSAHMLVLARHFTFHVATVTSFTTLLSLFHLTAVRLVIEHCLRSHTQTFNEGFMCLTENLGFGFPSASFRSKLYLSSLTTLTSRLIFKVEGR